MKSQELQRFVELYSPFYFELSNDEKKDANGILGCSIIHPTTKKKEDEIIGYLKEGKQNIKTIAWKMGGTVTDDGIRTQYHEYQRNVIERFCSNAEKMELPIINEINVSAENLYKSFNKLVELVCGLDLSGYGSVYIISSMFFLSKGNVPIYDYYANVAVKALLKNVSPLDVFVGQAPGKEEHVKGNPDRKLAVNMLIEYMDLLKDLAEGTEYFMKDGYISRELDQALWVYGHAIKKFE